MTTGNRDISQFANDLPILERTKRNIRMQYYLAKHTLIPWLKKKVDIPTNCNVCEIGCAEGGVLAAFAELGWGHALGTDVQKELLDTVSAPIMKQYGAAIEFTAHDVLYDSIPEHWKGAFTIVLLRDVIEHLDDPELALRNILRLLPSGGVVVVTFPPYTSAFGGHQQLLENVWGGFPFIHLLPRVLFAKIVSSGNIINQEEVWRLHRIRCSAKNVLTAAKNAGYNVVDERYFALRPVFRYKYQRSIPTFELTSLSWLPFVQELSMECAFIFRKP
jgi:SAM-dependent methyltransferase